MLARLATARNRELVNLTFLAVLTVAGFTAVLVARSGEVSSTSLVYAGALPRALPRRARGPAHAAAATPIRTCCRWSGSWPRSVSARSTASGPRWRATRRCGWRSASAVFVAVLVLLPDFRVLERYRYLCGRAGARAARVHDPLVLRDRHRDQRRAGVDPRRRPVVPARRVREGLPRPVPRRLPARAPRAPGSDSHARARHRAPAAAAARARCSAMLGRRAAAARRDERLRHVAALLRRVRGPGVRRDGARRVRGDRPRRASPAGSARRLPRSRRTSPSASRSGSTRGRRRRSSGYQIVQSLYTVADGGLFGSGLGRGYILTGPDRPVIPEVQTDFIYSAIAGELGLAGRGGAPALLRADRLPRLQDREPRR